MLSRDPVVNQPLREKLEAWRAQKVSVDSTEGSCRVKEISLQQKTAPGAWYRSVPTARRNNLILKSPASKASMKPPAPLPQGKTFAKKETKEQEHDEGDENQSNNATPHTVISKKQRDAQQVVSRVKDTESEQEIKRLKEENAQLSARLISAEATAEETAVRGLLAMQEVAAVNFLNEVLEQKNLELDCKISSERMTVNENASDKSRKHRQEVEKLRAEKEMFEKRADDLIVQLNEQMTQLQTVAMDRIADLEQQLMNEQEKNSQLEQTVSRLKHQASSAGIKHTEYVEEEDDGEEEEEDGSSTCSSSDTVNRSDADEEDQEA